MSASAGALAPLPAGGSATCAPAPLSCSSSWGSTVTLDELAGTLSGGQRKLLDLVRALMVAPRILLLDEPMAGVSPTLRVELLEHILALRDRDGLTLLIVEHDLDFVMRASDRVIVMNDGQVIAQGTPDEVRGDERVVDAYLGTRHEVA